MYKCLNLMFLHLLSLSYEDCSSAFEMHAGFFIGGCYGSGSQCSIGPLRSHDFNPAMLLSWLVR